MGNAFARKGRRRWGAVTALCVVLLGSPAPKAAASTPAPQPELSRQPLAPTTTQLRALARLQSDVPDLDIGWDARFGTPSSLQSRAGALTSPSTLPASQIANRWVQSHRSLFGGSAAVSSTRVRVVKTLVQPNGGPRIVLLHQRFGGLEGGALGGSIVVTVDRAGRVLLVRAAAARAASLLAGSHRVGAVTALQKLIGASATITGKRAGWTELKTAASAATQYARTVAFPVGRGPARPAIELIVIRAPDDAENVVVDAITGKVLRRRSLVDYAEARVFRNYPGAPKGGAHELRPVPAGWLFGGAPTTIGPNANTATNWLNVAGPPMGPGEVRAVGLDQPFYNSWAISDCKGPADTPQSYALDAPAATVNLFFHHNLMHDFFQQLGFTGAAGAMQTTGGPGPDPLIGMAQAGAVPGDSPGYTGRNNAFMMSLPDGLPSSSGMFLFEPIGAQFEAPCADGDFDSGVIYHEYTHGVTSRWVGGEYGNLGSLQGGAMGESWGDFYALHYLTLHGLADTTSLAAYATGNTTVGIRNFPLGEVPVGFDDIGYDQAGEEVHADGEIWNGVLWSIRTALANAAPKGAELAAQLIADAMPISGPTPSMLDMRHAILTADKARTGGRYNDVLWAVFAERGMGKSAKTKDADDGDPTPGFDHADATKNGGVTLKFLDARTGAAITNAALFVGGSEVRAMPVAATGSDGVASFPIIAGRHALTVRARGYGAQPLTVDVAAQKMTSQTVTLAANAAQPWNGARVLTATGGDPSGALDDTLATAWTSPAAKASDAGGTQSFVLRLAGDEPVQVRALQVGSYATDKASFDALRDFTIDVSADGKVWQQVVRDEFRGQAPTPSVLQLGMRRYDLSAAVAARYLRFSGRPQRAGPGRLQVGEIQVFGDLPGRGALAVGKRFHDEGTIVLPNAGSHPTRHFMKLPGMCGPNPPFEGITAHVTMLPAGFNDGFHTIRVTGELNPAQVGIIDVDVAFLSRECNFLGSSTGPSHELTTIPKHTKYVVIEQFANAGPVLARVDAFA